MDIDPTRACWVFIEDGIIKERQEFLPVNWGNITNLYLSENDLDYLKSLGWYKVTPRYSSYDNKTSRIQHYEYSIEGDNVFEINIVVPRAEADMQERYDLFMSDLRKERDKRLAETDWTQLQDVKDSHTDTWNNSWATYRNSLRNITNSFNNYSDIGEIIWPIKPNSGV